MTIQHVRRGSGKPLLLVHGLGSSRQTWRLVMLALAEHREVIAIDLPGHGATPAEHDSGTFAGLVRSLAGWLAQEGLSGIDMVGVSMGARLVLELARQGQAGNVVALDPGGFWEGYERDFVKATLTASGMLLRSLRPVLPTLARTTVGRTILLAQLAARPWVLNGDLIAEELIGICDTMTFHQLVQDLAYGPAQQGPAAESAGAIAIGWGRHDRLCFPSQALRAKQAFPEAHIFWFERSGHFPNWEQPTETVKLILDTVGGPESMMPPPA